MNTHDLFYWLALNQIEGVGPVSFVRLVEHFGSAQAVFQAKASELQSIESIRPSIVHAITSFGHAKDVDRELRCLQAEGIHDIGYRDNNYPQRLKDVASFPALLFVKGQADCLNKGDWLGVVGSRDLTEYGAMVCRRLVRELAQGGVGVVSGFARGIDITAHLAVLDCGGKTIGVLGGGFQYIHPPSHKRYIERVMDKGALVSEFPYHWMPRPQFFPRRNRIISGLSRGVLVVEADEKSGAMITAQYALDQNREVYAVPGSIFSNKSRGCHKLIDQGAKLVCGANDILEEWKYTLRTGYVPEINPDEHSVYQACLQQSQTPDEIIEKTGFATEKVTTLLTKLELEGKIRGLPGRRYESV